MPAALRRFIWVRHGETLGESHVRYHGRNDVKLSETGREQMRQAASRIEIAEIDRVVASSLSRSRESAEIIAPDREIAFEDDLREVHFGRWEGLTSSEIEELDPELFAQWQQGQSGRGFDYPEGERRADFCERVCRTVDLWLPGEGETVLAVAHKGVIRVAVEHVAGFELEDGEPRLGGVLALESRGQGPWRRSPGDDA